MLAQAHARAANRVLNDPRWDAVCARDAAADGRFLYAVKTTGVFCRPSCGARRPRPENVAFHATVAEAEHAGFRACKRCKPSAAAPAEGTAAQVTALCRLIEQSERVPTLEQLARHIGLSPFHTQRMFKAAVGVTPRAYAAARRAERMRRQLSASATVTHAMYEAGYAAASRFYTESTAQLGMTPTTYKRGGAGTVIRFAVGACSLGHVLVAATARGVCAIALGDDPQWLVHELERRFPNAELLGGDASFERVVATVVGLVERPNAPSALPLDIQGTAFQQRVWKALTSIPAGETWSYTKLAHAVGAPQAVRAVASACAANTLAVAIPCHRVVRTDGNVAGYRWGVERKRTLLAREARASRHAKPERERT